MNLPSLRTSASEPCVPHVNPCAPFRLARPGPSTRANHPLPAGLRKILLAGLPAMAVFFAGLSPSAGQWMPIPGESDEPPPTAPEIMERVRAAFPDVPLVIHARLERRAGQGIETRSLRATISLDWSAEPPTAGIRISDAFGRPLTEGRIVYRADGADIRIDGSPAPDPDLAIADTDFTWTDLALSFLWWPGGDFRGFESRRGRRCYVIDLAAPAPSADAASVRLWIDAHVYALLQAEIRASDGTATRRLSVRSLRRVGLRWTLEDLEMRDLAQGTRTLLRVEDLVAVETPIPEPVP